MPLSDSIFEVYYSVRTLPNPVIEEDWGTAFCCSYRDTTALVTARHIFMKAKLVPGLPVSVRAVGDKWEKKNLVDMHVVAHPVADIAVLLPQPGHRRTFVPFPLTDTIGLHGGEEVAAQGFLGTSRGSRIAPPLYTASGSVLGPPTITSYGRHRTVAVNTSMRELHGLSGAPVFLGEQVVGVYVDGVGHGARFICASQIAEV